MMVRGQGGVKARDALRGGVVGVDAIDVMPYISVMHRTTLYLTEAQRAKVRRLAAATGRTQADIIREAVGRLPEGGVRLPRSVGAGRGGPDLTERAEELLEGFGEEP